MSIFPKDKRVIQSQKRANFTRQELREYIDEKCAFNALVKEHAYQVGSTKEKEKEFGDNYMKSFIHRSEFLTTSLKKFKTRVKHLN